MKCSEEIHHRPEHTNKSRLLQFSQYHVRFLNLTPQECHALDILWKNECNHYIIDTDGYLVKKTATGLFGEPECELDEFRAKAFIDQLVNKFRPSHLE